VAQSQHEYYEEYFNILCFIVMKYYVTTSEMIALKCLHILAFMNGKLPNSILTYL
jgi:hypothetical protein